MSEPAIFETETSGTDHMNAALLDQLRVVWGETWLSFRDEVRARPPADGSIEEAEVLGRFAVTMLSAMGRLNADVLALLVTKVQGGVEAVWRREYTETSVERKLCMRLVGQALTTLADLLQEMKLHVASPHEAASATPSGSQGAVAHVDAWPAWARSIFKLELYTFIAFDLAAVEDTGEFCEWARRAVTAAREATATWHPSRVSAATTAPWSGDVIVTHLRLPGPEAERVAELLDHAPAPNDTLVAFLRDG